MRKLPLVFPRLAFAPLASARYWAALFCVFNSSRMVKAYDGESSTGELSTGGILVWNGLTLALHPIILNHPSGLALLPLMMLFHYSYGICRSQLGYSLVKAHGWPRGLSARGDLGSTEKYKVLEGSGLCSCSPWKVLRQNAQMPRLSLVRTSSFAIEDSSLFVAIYQRLYPSALTYSYVLHNKWLCHSYHSTKGVHGL